MACGNKSNGKKSGGGGYRATQAGGYSYFVPGGGGSGYVNPTLENASTSVEISSTNPDSSRAGYIRITVLQVNFVYSYIGKDSKAKKIVKTYIGKNNAAKKVVKGYIGVGGKAKLFYISN